MLPLFLLGAAGAGSGAGAAAGAGALAGVGAAAAKGAAGAAGGNFISRMFGREPEEPEPPYRYTNPVMPAPTNPFEGMLGGDFAPRRRVRILRPGGGGQSNFVDPGYARLLGG